MTPQALRRLAARIERHKVPDAIYLRDALPLGSTGKVLRAGVTECRRPVSVVVDDLHVAGDGFAVWIQ